jgi:diguanylate cyclase (GGDEF)-like protein
MRVAKDSRGVLAGLESMWPRRLRRLSARGWLLLAGAALIAGSIFLSMFTIWRLRADAVENAREDAYGFGVLIAEQTERSMQLIDLVLQQQRATILGSGISTPDEFAELASTRWVHDTLLKQLASVPQAEAIVLVAADGRVLNTTRSWPPAPINVSNLPHYQCLRDHEHTGLFVSEPLLNLTTATPTIYLSRRISGRQGEFLGIVQAAVRIKYFDDLYKSVTLTRGFGVTLLRSDGVVITRYPPAPTGFAARMPAQSPWHTIVGRGGGSYYSPGWLGNGTQFVAVHPLRAYPLVVDSTVSEDAAFAIWRNEVVLLVVETFAGIVCILLLIGSLVAKFDHLEQARASVAEKSRLLETTLEHMDQGLMMVRHDRRIGVYNAQALRMLDLPDALMQGNPSIVEVAAYQQQIGEFDVGGAARQDLEAILSFANLNTVPPRYERQRPNGRQLEVRTVAMSDGGFVRTYTDITERKAAEARVRYLAEHDELTGLANRNVLRDRLADALEHGRRDGCTGVLCLDLDDFKAVNDTIGHAAGDALLRLIADRLMATIRRGDVVARLGGDEFAIVQTGIANATEAHALAERLEDAFATPFDLGPHRVPIGLSIGIAIGPADGDSAEILLKNADIALYRAKADPHTCYRFFEPAMDVDIQQRRALELDLRRALTDAQFELYFQPVLDARTRVLTGFEALLRWRHPARGIVSPLEFIPLAEEVGLIAPIGEWVLREACRQAASWPAGVSIAINLSPVQVGSSGLVETLRVALAESGLAPGRLELEITESVLLRETTATMETLHALCGLGLRIALDDFGTGYSSLGYLRSFPFDRLKIDRCFVRELHAGTESLSIIRAILALGDALGMSITAEGVETEEQLALLQAEQCSNVQGLPVQRAAAGGGGAGIAQKVRRRRPAGRLTAPRRPPGRLTPPERMRKVPATGAGTAGAGRGDTHGRPDRVPRQRRVVRRKPGHFTERAGGRTGHHAGQLLPRGALAARAWARAGAAAIAAGGEPAGRARQCLPARQRAARALPGV